MTLVRRDRNGPYVFHFGLSFSHKIPVLFVLVQVEVEL